MGWYPGLEPLMWLTGYPARDCVLEGCQRTYPHGMLPQMGPRWGPRWGPEGRY